MFGASVVFFAAELFTTGSSRMLPKPFLISFDDQINARKSFGDSAGRSFVCWLCWATIVDWLDNASCQMINSPPLTREQWLIHKNWVTNPMRLSACTVCGKPVAGDGQSVVSLPLGGLRS